MLFRSEAMAAVSAPIALGAYLKIDQSNNVTIAIGSTEMGQGILTGLSQLVAEELKLNWSQVSAVQADAYAGFGHLYEGGRILEAACWAHARRGFYDIHQANQSPIAAQALERISALYAIEKEIRGRPPNERAAARQARAGPLLESMREWLRHTLTRVSKKRSEEHTSELQSH